MHKAFYWKKQIKSFSLVSNKSKYQRSYPHVTASFPQETIRGFSQKWNRNGIKFNENTVFQNVGQQRRMNKDDEAPEG